MWMSTKEACAYLGIGLRTLYRRIDRGEIPACKIGRTIRIMRGDLDYYVEQSRIRPGDITYLCGKPSADAG